MTETALMKTIQRDTAAVDVRLFRNNSGNFFQGTVIAQTPTRIVLENWRRVQTGLADGSGDLIGLRSLIITPEMVGRRVAVFASVEVKSKRGVAASHQKAWRAVLESLGAAAGFARSVDDARAILDVPHLTRPTWGGPV